MSFYFNTELQRYRVFFYSSLILCYFVSLCLIFKYMSFFSTQSYKDTELFLNGVLFSNWFCTSVFYACIDFTFYAVFEYRNIKVYEESKSFTR